MTRVPAPRRPGSGRELSLKARALRYLSMREHSRQELRRKLLPHVPPEQDVEPLLDELERANLLSDARFVESLVRRGASRFGTLRLQHDLGRHGVEDPLIHQAVAQLRQTEPARAREVWRRRFGVRPADAAERARQYRFLAQRGFDAQTLAALFRDIDRGLDKESDG